MSDKAWKQLERRVAAYFGGRRNSLSGQTSKAGAGDVLHPHLVVECKHRKRHAAVRLWDDCNELANREGKLPVVVLAERRRPGFWILVHSDDLCAVAACHAQRRAIRAGISRCGDPAGRAPRCNCRNL